MKQFYYTLIMVFCFLPVVCFADPPAGSDFIVVFQEDFNNSKLDETKWSVPGLHGNNFSDTNNVIIENGICRLKGENKAQEGNQFTSAAICTKDKYFSEYGYFEARVKMAIGQGFWSAFTGFENNDTYPPVLMFGEVGGDEPNNVWFGIDNDGQQDNITNWGGPDFTSDYHVFGCHWKENEVIWYVDGIERFRANHSINYLFGPYYLQFHLLVNSVRNVDETTPWPGYMYIDWVKVWKSKSEIFPNFYAKTYSIEFEEIKIGRKSTQQFTVYNLSMDSTLIISNIESSDAAFSIQPSQANVLVGDSLLFNVSFQPAEYKTYSADLKFYTNDPNNDVVTINLSGQGVDQPVVSTSSATNITQTTATLNGSVNPNGKSTVVKFEYGNSTAYGFEIDADPKRYNGDYALDVSADIEGLYPNSEVHFRVVATSEIGTSYGEDQSFMTEADTPVATTMSPTNVDTTSAVLHGLVNPLGKATRVVFEYGQTNNYGNEIIATPDTINGIDDVAVSALLTGLTKNKVYHYRIKAENEVGISYGQDEELRTTSVSAVVFTNAATNVSTNSAVLNAEVNPLGISTEVRFLYGTSNQYGNVIEASPSPVLGTNFVPVSANLTGLLVNESYHFCVEAENSAGISRGAGQTFSTSPSAPGVVTLAAADIDTNSVTLRGKVNPKGQSTEIKFEYGTTVAYGLEIEAEQSPVLGTDETDVSARLTGLSENTVYHYRVVATNASGTMTGSNQSFMPSVSKPSARTLPVTALSMKGCRVHGTVNPKGRTVTVKFQYSQDLSFNQEVTADESPVDGAEDVPVSATLTGLQSDATYYIRVMATNGIDSTFAPGQTFTTLRDNQLPTIAPIAVGNATSNQSQTISAILSDNVGVQIAYLKYRQGGTAHYDSTQMSWIGGDNYESAIPASKVTERGLEYFIAVNDSAGNRATYPKNDAENNPRILRVANNNLPFGSSVPGQVYRMIAVPFDLDNPSVNNVLADDLGSYNIKQWRLFKHVNGEDVEYGTSGFSTFEPGTGFWLVSKETTTLDAGSGKSVLTSEPYVITLSPGWNQIGNPFAFPVAWEDVTKDNVIEYQLVGYSGSVNDASGYDYTKTILEPWEGYFVNNTSNDDVYITIPAREAGSMAKSLPNEILSTLSESEWGVQLKVISPKYFDKDNYIGCLKDASEGFDEKDFSEAPLLQHHLSLSFEDNLTADFRPITTVGYTWNTMIRGTKDQSITLSIEQMKHFPEDWQLVLLDETCQIRIDLKNRMSYRTILSNPEHNYQILAGTEEYIKANDQGYKGTPTAFKLNQNYPNPFNPTTKISYELPEQSDIQILVFNMLGQQVTTLLNQTQSAGRYDILWNGMDENSNQVSGGMYFVMMQAGGYREVKKMVLVR